MGLASSIYTGEGHRIDDYVTKIMDLTHFFRHLVGEPRNFDQDLERIISAIEGGLPPDHPTLAITEFNA